MLNYTFETDSASLSLSPSFVIKVMILETGTTKWLGLGVVFEDYGTDLFPGWEKGTVGYHTNDRKIFEAGYTAGYISKKTTGLYHVIART